MVGGLWNIPERVVRTGVSGSAAKENGMRKLVVLLVVGAVVLGSSLNAFAGKKHRVGGGIHYWETVDDLDDFEGQLKKSGMAYMFSYQFAALPFGLLKLEGDLEVFPDGYGGFDKTAWAPQFYVVIGGGIYAALGMGMVYENQWLGPFYALRAGLDIGIIPTVLYLDISANYQVAEWEAVSDVKTVKDNIGSLTFGAVARVEF